MKNIPKKSFMDSFNYSRLTNYFTYFTIRGFIAIYISAYHHPDEFWQSQEVAHNNVFSNGYLTWEWTREDPIRSPLYPMVFSFYFSILKFLSIDYQKLVAYGPRIVQCLLTALYDVYLVRISSMFGIKKWNILLVNYTMWYSITFFSKTFINTFETCLFLIAVYYWMLFLQTNNQKYNQICRIIVIINLVARPTAIIPWTIIWPLQLIFPHFQLTKAIKIVIINIITLLIVVIFSIGLDILYYKKITSSAYNFVYFNFLTNENEFFGFQSVHWYISEGIPYILMGWLLFLFIGLYKIALQRTRQQLLLLTYLFYFVAILSVGGHKEDRFLMPIIPLLMIVTAMGLEIEFKYIIRGRVKQILVVVIVATQFIYCYVSNFFLNPRVSTLLDQLINDNPQSIYFFTSCYSSPYYSYVHQDIPMGFPGCAPTMDRTIMETTLLLNNPLHFIRERIESSHPSHIVLYNKYLIPPVEDYLKQQSYELINEMFYKYEIYEGEWYYAGILRRKTQEI